MTQEWVSSSNGAFYKVPVVQYGSVGPGDGRKIGTNASVKETVQVHLPLGG
jgi:hypothetical protein